ncbi:MAG TPA: type II secretion system protein [Gallionellaceae bacterium]|nr:type II secretion system protein [Gallionellaceae bacterium]
MTELITVIVIVGIMSAIVMPRFFDRNTFDARGFYDQTIATLRYAQKTAISQRRLVCVTFPSTSRIVLRTAANFGAAACDTDLQNPSATYPAGQTTYTIDAPAGVVLAGAADFNFDSLGRTSLALAPITVDVFTITIDQETGYVR